MPSLFEPDKFKEASELYQSQMYREMMYNEPPPIIPFNIIPFNPFTDRYNKWGDPTMTKPEEKKEKPDAYFLAVPFEKVEDLCGNPSYKEYQERYIAEPLLRFPLVVVHDEDNDYLFTYWGKPQYPVACFSIEEVSRTRKETDFKLQWAIQWLKRSGETTEQTFRVWDMLVKDILAGKFKRKAGPDPATDYSWKEESNDEGVRTDPLDGESESSLCDLLCEKYGTEALQMVVDMLKEKDLLSESARLLRLE